MEKKTCTFFGHRDSPDTIKPKIRAAVIDLIENHGVTMFYVGNQGNFDRLVRSVLAYMPSAKKSADDFSDTLLPDGIEKVPKRFAISWRNKWMIEHADYVVTYVTRLFGGAAQFSALAKSKGKIIYDIK